MMIEAKRVEGEIEKNPESEGETVRQVVVLMKGMRWKQRELCVQTVFEQVFASERRSK